MGCLLLLSAPVSIPLVVMGADAVGERRFARQVCAAYPAQDAPMLAARDYPAAFLTEKVAGIESADWQDVERYVVGWEDRRMITDAAGQVIGADYSFPISLLNDQDWRFSRQDGQWVGHSDGVGGDVRVDCATQAPAP